MARRRDRKRDSKPKTSEGETPHFNLPENDYFLGFKLKRFNELWRWDNLEDVDFTGWRSGDYNSKSQYGNDDQS